MRVGGEEEEAADVVGNETTGEQAEAARMNRETMVTTVVAEGKVCSNEKAYGEQAFCEMGRQEDGDVDQHHLGKK